MTTFDDDADAGRDSGDEFDNEDEEMEDVNDQDQDQGNDHGQDDDGGEDDDEEDNDDNDNDGDNDDDDDEEQSPSRRTNRHSVTLRSSSSDRHARPNVVLTSPSPRTSNAQSPSAAALSGPSIPTTRPEALLAQAYDIVPTMAAPQSTSINAIASTPDMHWVFTGGADGYVRMFNWMETVNGKVPLTVAQKHPFVDSVMKAGSLVTYWENEDSLFRTPPNKSSDPAKWLSPVYSLAVQHQALWLLSGLESGGINLQTCRHQAGTRITTLKEHTSAVSVLKLSDDCTSLLSGSWDKMIYDWDLQTGKVKRSFGGNGGQISSIECRPLSDVSVPELAEPFFETSGTFSTNNANRTMTNGVYSSAISRRASKVGDQAAVGSPDGSLFGDGGTNSLFGDDSANALVDGEGSVLNDHNEYSAREPVDALFEGSLDEASIGAGGPVQTPEPVDATEEETSKAQVPAEEASPVGDSTDVPKPNGLPHSDEPLTAPPTDESSSKTGSAAELPPHAESTFLSTSINGTLRIWDRRMSNAVATITPYGGVSPWCTNACWSPDGNSIYAGRRNCTVDEYSIHKLGSSRNKPERVFRFQQGSGPVYAVRSMPNGRHLVCASQDILRIYDLASSDSSRHRSVPFTIVPGHRGGVISHVHIDPACRYMLSAAGNRGWEGGVGTEVLLGYEIGVQDASGTWLR